MMQSKNSRLLWEKFFIKSFFSFFFFISSCSLDRKIEVVVQGCKDQIPSFLVKYRLTKRDGDTMAITSIVASNKPNSNRVLFFAPQGKWFWEQDGILFLNKREKDNFVCLDDFHKHDTYVFKPKPVYDKNGKPAIGPIRFVRKIHCRVNRTLFSPEEIKKLFISWDKVEQAKFYHVSIRRIVNDSSNPKRGVFWLVASPLEKNYIEGFNTHFANRKLETLPKYGKNADVVYYNSPIVGSYQIVVYALKSTNYKAAGNIVGVTTSSVETNFVIKN